MNTHQTNELATAETLQADAERHRGWVFFLLSTGGITAAFGVVTLLGWVWGWPRLTSFGAGQIPMAPSTAVLFLLYGAAIGLRARPPLSRHTFQLSTTLSCLGTLVALLLFTLSSRGLHWSAEHIALPITGTVGVSPQGYMSPLTAFCFLLSGLSFLASLAKVATPLWRTTLAWGAAGVLSGLCLILLLAYLYGTPLLYGGTLIPPALNTVLAFMVLSLSLLALAYRSAGLFRRASGDNSITGFALVLIFLLLASGIVTTGWLFYRSSAQRYRAEMEHQLSAIAELKVAELTQWRRERLGDGALLLENAALTALVRRFFDKPEDVDAQRQLKVWLGKYAQDSQYDRVLLLDALGTERLTASANPEPVAAHLAQEVATVLQSGRMTLLDFHRGAPDGPIHLGVLVPILDEADAKRPLGAVMLRINPESFLYPFIKRWPTPSLTAETLLVRREGNEAVLLNELRFQTHTALAVRSSLAKTYLPAVKAALGLAGIVEGIDYRGVPVVGDVRAIPESPWFMVTRMDTSEVYGPLHKRLWMALVLIAVLLFGAGAGLGLVWRQQRARFYREQYEMSEESRASELRYRRLFESAKDGILILNAETGMVVEANPFLTQLLGLTHEDFLGKKVWELGFFKDIAANAAKFAELQEKDYVRYENLPLETRDGRKIEVEFVSNVYLVSRQRVIQCNIRDITARKRTERLAKDVLAALNRPNNTKNIIRDILAMIKTQTGIEAVGIRLKVGEDFPYYQTHGFPDDFVQLKNQFCAHDAAGQILHGGQDHPVLACMCGNVICGRIDTKLPYFTAAGSFWTNCATELLATITGAERLARTLNRCHGAGYESVVMIPLRAGTETIGLLQLLDHRRNQLTTELITVMEWLGASVGVALTRMRAEDTVRESKQMIEGIINAIPARVFWKDKQLVYLGCNAVFARDAGFDDSKDIIGKNDYQMGWREQAELYRGDDRQVIESGCAKLLIEEPMTSPAGEILTLLTSKLPLRNAKGEINGILGTYLDISDRKRAETALQESERFAQATVDALSAHIAVLDATGTIIAVNHAWRAFAEANPPFSAKVCVGTNYLSVCDAAQGPDSAEAAASAAGIRAVLSGAQSDFELEYPCHSPETQRWFICRVRRFPGPETARVVVAHENITARKQVEIALQEQERLLSKSQSFGHIGSWHVAMPDHMLWSSETYNVFGVSRNTFTPSIESLTGLIHPDDRMAMRAWIAACGAGTKPAALVFRIITPDGTIRYIRGNGDAEFDAEHKLRHLAGTAQDVTELTLATADQARLATAVDQASEAIMITDLKGLIIYTNPAFEKITGYSRQDVYGQIWHFYDSDKHSEEFYLKMWAALTAGHLWSGHLINRRKDGTRYEEEATISPVRDAKGQIINFVAIKRDVTREVALEMQNQQNAKTEAVGQLAGGVAHDFNNKLQIIMGCSEFLLNEIPPTSPFRTDLLDIQEAAQRSADLTRQLLAFSRQQAITPVLLDLNAAIAGSMKMLRRLIGENIQLHFVPQSDLGYVFMDPSQMDQMLVNLAVNARDAILGTGNIFIEAANRTLQEADCQNKPDFVPPGEYVAVSFRDDGAGMTNEIQARIFEPFFTTKDVGKGTGLGLATVYGIVKQNNGAIGVQSVPGQGTTFTILLPLSSEAAFAAAVAAQERITTGTETVLVVEDERNILLLVQRTLVAQGYKVLTAIRPRLALEVCAQYHEPIHLLLSDVIMPEMSGKELAERIQKFRPGIRVLFMSGYSAAIMEQHGQMPAGLHVLQKPFSTTALAQHIRAALDAPAPGG